MHLRLHLLLALVVSFGHQLNVRVEELLRFLGLPPHDVQLANVVPCGKGFRVVFTEVFGSNLEGTLVVV